MLWVVAISVVLSCRTSAGPQNRGKMIAPPSKSLTIRPRPRHFRVCGAWQSALTETGAVLLMAEAGNVPSWGVVSLRDAEDCLARFYICLLPRFPAISLFCHGPHPSCPTASANLLPAWRCSKCAYRRPGRRPPRSRVVPAWVPRTNRQAWPGPARGWHVAGARVRRL